MTIWRMEAVARPDDPRWMAGPRYERIYVRAGSPAEARLCAGKTLAPNPAAIGNESAEQPSPFEDATLYKVARSSAVEAGLAAAEEGEPAVLGKQR